MDIVVMNYGSSTVTKYTNCPDEWEAEQIENYLFETLGLKESEVCYMAGECIEYNEEECEEDFFPTMEKATAYMREYKKNHPGVILLFRCGDFYESYLEDADMVSLACGIVVTMRGRTNMVSFNHYKLDTYLPKLIRFGCRVAICDLSK